MKDRGNVWKYGDNVDTDVIIPARYLNVSTPEELAEHCMEDLDQRFADNVAAGDVILAGENFGCGSSREHAPLAIKGAKVCCVVAKSFARIFYRNAINVGLPILECVEAVNHTQAGDQISIDLATGEVKNLTSDRVFKATPYPPFMMRLIQAGGLVPFTLKRLNAGFFAKNASSSFTHPHLNRSLNNAE